MIDRDFGDEGQGIHPVFLGGKQTVFDYQRCELLAGINNSEHGHFVAGPASALSFHTSRAKMALVHLDCADKR